MKIKHSSPLGDYAANAAGDVLTVSSAFNIWLASYSYDACYADFMFTGMAIVCGMLSMLGYGLSSAASQPLARKLGTTQVLFWRGLLMMAVLAVGAVPAHREFSYYKDILITIGLGVAGYLPLLAFTHGVKISRITIMSSISGTAPLITVLLSFLVLGARIRPAQWGAIVIVIAANIAMSVDLRNWRNSSVVQLSSGIPFALVAALGWGGFYFLLIYPTRWLGPWFAAFLVETGVAIAAATHLLISGGNVRVKGVFSKSLALNALLSCVGTVAYTYGIKRYNVGIVAALSSSTAVVAAVVATYMFHERLTRKEKLAASAMVAGVVVLTLF